MVPVCMITLKMAPAIKTKNIKAADCCMPLGIAVNKPISEIGEASRHDDTLFDFTVLSGCAFKRPRRYNIGKHSTKQNDDREKDKDMWNLKFHIEGC